jgi:nucleolar protein 4
VNRYVTEQLLSSTDCLYLSTTVFVSSLPYTATTTDLITHFSFLGPVRHGFIATDRESGKSKGVGYVTYSLREDAEKAIEELDGGEFGGKGRKIKVIWADHKVCFDGSALRFLL